MIKLWRVGITGRIWQWFKCYLSGRSQFVSIDGILSSSCPVTSGVPQGSILGPLLFSIYINDLPDYLSFSSPLLFADDTKCIGGISSPVDHALLQSDLVSLQSWCTAWDLSFNSSKCKSLSISMHSQSTVPVQPYSISSSDIASVDHHKDLGTIFTSNLTWNLHRSSVIGKAYRSLFLIRRTVSNFYSPGTLLSLYVTLVRSKLSYCSQIWRPHLVRDMWSFESLQRRATKFILRDYTSCYKDRLQSLKLLSLSLWFDYLDLMLLVKSLKRSARITLTFITISNLSHFY